MTKSPSVIVPARIERPPMTIIITPITPEITAVPAPTADVPVIVLATLRNSLCAPRAKTSRSRGSATYTFTRRTPPIVSASRPVTSALIAPRSRKSGRSSVERHASSSRRSRRRMSSVALVSFQFR